MSEKKRRCHVIIAYISLSPSLSPFDLSPLISILYSNTFAIHPILSCPALHYHLLSYQQSSRLFYSFIKLSFICSTFLKSQLAQYPHLLCHHISPLPLPRPVSYFICSSSSSPFSSSPLLSLFLPPPPSFPPVLHLLVPC